jgi:glycosyltransferase involved in cell wall biosynthesis
MKLAFYSPTRGPLDFLQGQATECGGAEKQIAYLMRALSTRGHEVHLFYGGAAQATDTEAGGIRIHPIQVTWRHPQSLVQLWQTLNRVKPALIYARLPDDFLWMLGLFARLHRSSRFVYALAADILADPWRTYTYNRWFHGPLYALGLAAADAVFIQHEGQRALVKPYSTGKALHVPSIIHPIAPQARRFCQTDYDAIWVAQVRPFKRLPLFLDLVEQSPHLHFAMVGGFNNTLDRQTQRKLQCRIRLLPNLEYLGLQTPQATHELIRRSKVLVNTSSEEGFPNTMLEAWSVGVPVVSLSVDPGAVIQRHRLGLVSGAVERMSQDLDSLVASPALNDTLGRNGYAYVQAHHSLDAVCTTFEQMMNDVVEGSLHS